MDRPSSQRITTHDPLSLSREGTPVEQGHFLTCHLPLGRLEIRHRGDHIEILAYPWNSHVRLTLEPVVSNEIQIRLEG